MQETGQPSKLHGFTGSSETGFTVALLPSTDGVRSTAHGLTRMRFPPALKLVFPLLLLAGCTAERNAAPVERADAGATTTPATSTPMPDDSQVTMRYDCDRQVKVDVMQDGHARASMPDGRIAKLSRIANSTPPVFTGAALYFRIGNGNAFLSEDEGEEVACRPQ